MIVYARHSMATSVNSNTNLSSFSYFFCDVSFSNNMPLVTYADRMPVAMMPNRTRLPSFLNHASNLLNLVAMVVILQVNGEIGAEVTSFC